MRPEAEKEYCSFLFGGVGWVRGGGGGGRVDLNHATPQGHH